MDGQLVGSIRGEKIELRLSRWRNVIIPSVSFLGRIRKDDGKLCLEGKILPSLIHRGIASLWGYGFLSLFGASIVLWALDVIVSAPGLWQAIYSFVQLIAIFGVLILVAAIIVRAQFSVLKDDRAALLATMQRVLSADLAT